MRNMISQKYSELFEGSPISVLSAELRWDQNISPTNKKKLQFLIVSLSCGCLVKR